MKCLKLLKTELEYVVQVGYLGRLVACCMLKISQITCLLGVFLFCVDNVGAEMSGRTALRYRPGSIGTERLGCSWFLLCCLWLVVFVNIVVFIFWWHIRVPKDNALSHFATKITANISTIQVWSQKIIIYFHHSFLSFYLFLGSAPCGKLNLKSTAACIVTASNLARETRKPGVYI